MQVGFIGLGTVGDKMAAHLQKAGHHLVVHDVRRDAAAPYLAAGAVWADTPQQVAEATKEVSTVKGTLSIAFGTDGRPLEV